MTSQGNPELLNALDRRLALGEVDLATYKELRAKFSAEASATAADPVGQAVDAMPVVAKSLDCPACMAALPLDESWEEKSVITCTYCGQAFALGTAEEEMERLRADIQMWISQLAGSTATSSTVDEASRSYIFREKVFPRLRTACDRATEVYALSRHQPLFNFPLMDLLAKTPFSEALAMSPANEVLAANMKDTLARLRAPAVRAFAVRGEDTRALTGLQVQCQELVHFGNARRQISNGTPDGYEKAISNLDAVVELYEDLTGSGVDDAADLFYEGMTERVKAVQEAIEAVRQLTVESAGFAAEETAATLDRCATNCEESATKIQQSETLPNVAIPAADAARADAAAIRHCASVVTLYDRVDLGSENAGFEEFTLGLSRLIRQVRPQGATATWLGAFVNALYAHLSALDGEQIVHAVPATYEWADQAAASRCQSGFLGGSETYAIEEKVLLPVWAAHLCFSESTGRIIKRGHSAECTLLLDASRHGSACVSVSGDAFETSCSAVRKGSASLPKSTPVVLPVVAREEAVATVKSQIAQHEEFHGGYADLDCLVYIPAVRVSYSWKKGDRSVTLLPDGSAFPALHHTSMNLGATTILVASS